MERQKDRLLWIGGHYQQGTDGEFFDNLNPATGDVICRVAVAGAKDVDRAVRAARDGLAQWRAMDGTARGRVLMRAARLLRDQRDDLARLESLDAGKPISETPEADVDSAADCLEYFAGQASSLQGEYQQVDGGFFYTRPEPLGVCAGIGAWNYPLQIAAWKSAPALAAGNAMIFKPAELTPLSALSLAEVFQEAGLPDGVFNVVQGFAETGQALTAHPGIDKVSLTGEVGTGKAVMRAASDSLKAVTLELGGKSPLIVCEDADLDRAADIAVMANFFSSGQVCTNGTRVFVPAGLKTAFEAKLLERVQRIRLGDPQQDETNFGPLVSFAHMNKVLDYIAQGKAAGARLLCGGERVTEGDYARGAFVAPTVFSDCSDDMTIVREEIFGPVLSLLEYQDEDEVIRRANDTEYGLAAGVVTTDLARAHRIIHRLEAGICWINTWGESPAQMPVGGYKQSGIGRENGIASLAHYTRVKSVQVELGEFASVF